LDVFEAVRKRRSIRQYKRVPVEDEKLLKVLEAARLAPSADNRQPWRFIVVKDPKVREELVRAHGKRWLAEAPIVIVACALPGEAWIRRDGEEYWKVDVAIAVEHMVLVAVDLGLATCWACSFNETEVKNILGVPGEARVVALLALGYPDEVKGEVAERRELKDVVCLDKWCWS